MRKNYGFILFLFSLLNCAGFAHAQQLTVLSASPKGQLTEQTRQSIQIHFNQPVVALGEETQFSSQNCPLSIAPQVPGTCRYSGTQTLVFEPNDNWPLSTRFNVTLKKGFTSKISKQKLENDYTFSFTTQVPQVRQVLPYQNEHWVSLNPSIYVLFNMPVHTGKMANYVVLDVNGKYVPVAVRPATQEEHKKIFSYEDLDKIAVITPSETLQKGAHYVLLFQKGLPASVGTAGMAEPFSTDFYTYPDLKIISSQTSGCLPFNPSINFSSPVRLKELVRATKVFPASAKKEISAQEENYLGEDHVNQKTGEAFFRLPLSFIELKPHQTVTVTLQKGMQDIYGNSLNQDQLLTLTNDGYCPAVDFSGGRGVLESYLKPFLPIDLMNIPSLPLRAARFNKDNFIPFDQQEKSYCKENPLADPTFTGEYTFTDVKDRTIKTFVDLAKFKPTSQNSIIFSQVQIKRGENKPCWISSTDNITDVGITFKTSGENILLWITSLQNGTPLPGMAVELRNRENKIIWSGTTDEKGLAQAPGWNKLEVEMPQWGRPPLYAFVTSPGGDGVVSNLWDDGMELWRFNIDYTYSPTSNEHRSFLFTDRGIYRPGETVYVKGIMRTLGEGSYHTPGKNVTGQLVVSDARGEEIIKKKITLSSQYGTFDTSFKLPETAFTGYWNLTFIPSVDGKESEENRAYASIQVETVEAAQFKLNVRSTSENFLPEEEGTFLINAQYQFGAPLADAPVTWTLRQAPLYFTPKGYEKYTFSPYFVRENVEDGTKLLWQSSGKLDGIGTFSFSSRMPRETYPVSVFAQVNVQSPARQDLFSRTSVTVHPASFYLGAKVSQEKAQSGHPVSLDIVAVTPEGKPTTATVVAEIYKEQWFSVRKTSLAGRLEWVSEKEIIPLPTQVLQVGKKGAVLTFVPSEGGNYYVRLSSSDEMGHRVIGGESVYVYGEKDAYWRQREDDLLTLKQNKNEYKVGQTARIQVESGYENATALVTVEREGILDAWVTQVKGGASYIPVKIKENYLPNVYIGVVMIQGRTDKPVTDKLDLGKPQAKAGYVNLNVVPAGKKIETNISANASKYRPGEKVTLSLSTKVQGKAIPAEVTVMAVDEGILDLTNYQTPDPFAYFYGSRPLSVFTMDNRAFIIGQRNFGEKGQNRGGGGSASAALGGTDIRSNFKFTPYFKANVMTDEKGRGTVSFTLPDNLTKFRIMAVAVREEEFGRAETRISVTKPIMVQPNLPRFARKGDTFRCGAIVHNYEDKKGNFTVTAQASGALMLEGESEQTVQVAQGKTQEVTWACKATQSGKATVIFTLKGSQETDGVQQELSVSEVEKSQTLTVYGSVSSRKQELIAKPENLDPTANNEVHLSLASTALLNIQGAITYLMTYPYDCLEQQLSKIVPMIAGEKLLDAFGIGSPKKNRVQVQEVLGHLSLYQYPTGGLSYWKNRQPDPYVTAYGLEVSALAKQQGYQVAQDVLKKAVAYLKQAFEKETVRRYSYSNEETQVVRAYIAYVLALYGENVEATFNTLYSNRTSLPTAANAYLLKTAALIHRPQQQQESLAQQLFNHMVYDPSAVFVDVPTQMPYLHLDNVGTTALVLDSLLQRSQPFDAAPQMVAWLLSQLNAQGHWKNTSTNALVLRVLLSYYQKQESQAPHFEGSVMQGKQSLLTHSFQGHSMKEASTYLPFSTVYGSQAQTQLDITKNGEGTLYYTIGQTYTPASYKRSAGSGLHVTRLLTTFDDRPVQQIVAGERYKVTLSVTTAASRSFVALEDFIPAGFELVSTRLATEDSFQEDSSKPSVFDYTEQYDDRIVAFADLLPAGTHTFSYTVAARVRGEFSYPAAWVSQMYAPEVFGRNTTSVMVVQ
ncbi:MAG: Ig-like domain-containing protein [Elusimicrobiaceae bacterium]|nr:Ig-like domain-containing protein [Elusimicrobiaceae bacterium]